MLLHLDNLGSDANARLDLRQVDGRVILSNYNLRLGNRAGVVRSLAAGSRRLICRSGRTLWAAHGWMPNDPGSRALIENVGFGEMEDWGRTGRQRSCGCAGRNRQRL